MHSPKAPKPSIAQQQSASRANAPVQPFAGSPGSQLGGLLGDQSMWFSYMRPRSRPPLGSLPTDPGATSKKPPGVGQLEDGNWVNQRPRNLLGPPTTPGTWQLDDGNWVNQRPGNPLTPPTPGSQLDDGNWVDPRPSNPLLPPVTYPGAPAGQTPKTGKFKDDKGADPRLGNPLLPPAIYPGAPAGQTPKTGKFKVGLW